LSLPSNNINKKPIVLSLSGHDPTGGAGIQADAESFTHFGCHPCSVITCLTVQDSQTVQRLIPISADDITQQAKALFNDMPIAVIKIGLTGSVDAIKAIAKIINLYPDIPVVFDPVLACGDGTPLANIELISAIRNELLPLTTVLTPNTIEATQLAGLQKKNDIDSLGLALLNCGSNYVLITGGHVTGSVIQNHLFHQNKNIATYECARQIGDFHGTGCTLASAIAALMAKGHSVPSAIELAQPYVDKAIQQAIQFGKGQRFLNRSQK
jgi:hydroxymethylpyrimidine/phosphomethylpyrimidine kinase